MPVEILYAAGCIPIDLNNLFVTSQSASAFIDTAEKCGFPRTCCSWTKGIYGAVRHYGIKRVVFAVQGDCSNNHALAQMLEYEGVECIPFAFPYRRDESEMEAQLNKFAAFFGLDMREAEHWRRELEPMREAARRIDSLTWRECKVHGIENHLWLVSAGDFCSDPANYAAGAGEFLEEARHRDAIQCPVRIGLVGVPPIVPEILEFLESRGAHVVFNETSRQFAMPSGGITLRRQYSDYTYPYGIVCRLKDIRRETERRGLDGLIHYVQSFCFRRIEDKVLREAVQVPVITLEQDRPGPISGQLKTRLEAFVELLASRKKGLRIF